jgi:hypothetical protein
MRKIFIAFSGIAIVMSYVFADDHYVAQNGQIPSAPYASWISAASNIQDAVNAATTNSTVWVGAGRYTVPSNATNFVGTNVVFINRPLILKSSNGVASSTVIDGGGTNRGIAVYYPFSSTNRFVLDGFTISNCFATNIGGGILFYSNEMDWTGVVQNCIVSDNIVAWGTNGGLFFDNTAGSRGGGIGCYNTYCRFGLNISNCVIRNNRALHKGTALGVGSDGGGVSIRSGIGNIIVDNCLIISNEAVSAGGFDMGFGFYVFRNCEFSHNKADVSDSGLIITSAAGGALEGGRFTLRNCFIHHNNAFRGGGIYITLGDNYIYNSTIVSNSGGEAGAIRIRYISHPNNANLRIWNSIIYSNSFPNIQVDGYTNITPEGQLGLQITNSCFLTNGLSFDSLFNLYIPGTGNITNDPQFVNFSAGDCRLQIASPCINTGTNQDWMTNSFDIQGHDRIIFDKVDMGAFEYGGPVIAVEPQSVTNNPDSPASFSITAAGAAPFFYQWQKDTTNIAGAAATNYSIASVHQTDEGGYRCIVTNIEGMVTSSVACLTLNISPNITAQPQSQTNNAGQPASFSVQSSGTSPLIYQWQKDATNINGATSTNYSIDSIAETNEGNYCCVVTNMAGSVTSSFAMLSVNDPPVITVNPFSQTNNPSSSVTFSLIATGTTPLIYQWQQDGTNIFGATSINYSIASAVKNDEGNYRCCVTNMAGAVTSSVACLIINDSPVITSNPQSITNNPGQAVTFSIIAAGTTPLYYQWKQNGFNIDGATGMNYEIPSVTQSDEGNYQCLVSNVVCSVTSIVALLTVNDPPLITSNPQSSINNPGSPVTFTVLATGMMPLYYQWQKNEVNISDALATSFTITSVMTNDKGNYRCIVSNQVSAATSAVATLTVNALTLLPPVGVSASDGTCTDKVVVTWSTVIGASGYQVWRAAANNSAAAFMLGQTIEPTFDDNSSAVRLATMFYYWVKAFNSMATSDFSIVDNGFCRMSADPLIISGQPLVGDYDGDGKADPAVYNLANGRLFAWLSSAGYVLVTPVTTFQVSVGELPVAGDFDGDGLADPGVFNCKAGSWYIWLSSADYILIGPMLYGLDANGIPVPADYDGDRKTDPAVYQVHSGEWYVWLSSAVYMKVGPFSFHQSLADIPAPGQFDGDHSADPAVYQQSSGAWYMWLSSAGYIPLGPIIYSTIEDHIAVPADYDGDGLCDPAVYVPSLGKWRIWSSGSGYDLIEMELR